MITIKADILENWDTQPNKKMTKEQLDEISNLFNGKKLPDDYCELMINYGYKQFDILGSSCLKITYDAESKADELERIEQEKCLCDEDCGLYDDRYMTDDRQITIDFFYPFDSFMENYNSYTREMEFYDDIRARIPPEMVPIGAASSRSQGQILLSLRDEDYGSIWYWERIDETWGTGYNQYLGYMGTDLSEVFGKLTVSEN